MATLDQLDTDAQALLTAVQALPASGTLSATDQAKVDSADDAVTQALTAVQALQAG